MRTKITNISTVSTWSPEKNKLISYHDVEILIEDSMIIQISNIVGKAEEEIDADGALITPGFIDTDMTRSIPEDIFKERLSSIEMQRIGTPADVANCALFLASDLSSYVTGQIIGVDGGMLI